jgi:hypothetical protein
VTHSMGGLVARYYSEVMGFKTNVLGIVHGVMPATGAAAAYKRVKAGTEGLAGLALGDDAAKMTTVFAQAPGALQLLPSADYGMGWLKIRDGNELVSLPKEDPYGEIYTKRNKWWGLVDDRLINPIDTYKKSIDDDWKYFTNLIWNHVKTFHVDISDKYHDNTFAFYGDDSEHKAWGDVFWRRRVISGVYENHWRRPSLDDPCEGSVISDDGHGSISVAATADGNKQVAIFDVQLADENGDGTVPARSGRIPSHRVNACIAYPGIDHESAYKGDSQRLFALWAITKIAYRVKLTNMAYAK